MCNHFHLKRLQTAYTGFSRGGGHDRELARTNSRLPCALARSSEVCETDLSRALPVWAECQQSHCVGKARFSLCNAEQLSIILFILASYMRCACSGPSKSRLERSGTCKPCHLATALAHCLSTPVPNLNSSAHASPHSTAQCLPPLFTQIRRRQW